MNYITVIMKQFLLLNLKLTLLMSQVLLVSQLLAQDRNYESIDHCDFKSRLDYNCFLFIKESDVKKRQRSISQICDTARIQGLDSMMYAVRIFELDTIECKLGFTFQCTSIIIPNSEYYLVSYYPVTHVFTLETGHRVFISMDKKVNVALAEKMFDLRAFSEGDSVQFKINRKPYRVRGASGIYAYVELEKDYQTVVKGYPKMMKGKYLKYFSNYSEERARIHGLRLREYRDKIISESE